VSNPRRLALAGGVALLLAALAAPRLLGLRQSPDEGRADATPRTAATTTASRPASSRPASDAPAVPRGSGIAVPSLGTHPAHLDDLPGLTAEVAPVRMRIAGVDVDAAVVGVGVAGDGSGELDVPPRADLLSWYRFGASPGDAGSAVVAGHVDYNGREGVFFRLDRVEPGTDVVVTYDDGTQRHFRVVERHEYAKPDLPVADLFRDTGEPRLVLITCGGSFDRSARSYRDNLVLVAEPVTA